MSDAYEDFCDAVVDLVDRIPPGRVMTYGAIAELLQRGGPRGVGGVMAREGPRVPWWRVVRANGTLPAHLVIDAQQQWLREGTPTRRGIVDIERARWWPDGLPEVPVSRHVSVSSGSKTVIIARQPARDADENEQPHDVEIGDTTIRPTVQN